MGGGVLEYAARPTPQIDAEIGRKGHLWTETGYISQEMKVTEKIKDTRKDRVHRGKNSPAHMVDQ